MPSRTKTEDKASARAGSVLAAVDDGVSLSRCGSSLKGDEAFLMDDVLIDEVAGLMEKRAPSCEDGKLCELFRKTFHGEEPRVKVLYIGPFVLDSVLHLKSSQWKERLENEYDIQTEMVIWGPSFSRRRHRVQGILAQTRRQNLRSQG